MAQNATIESTLALGIVQNETQTPFEYWVQQTLNKVSINALVHVFQTIDDAFKALAEGKIASLACPLHLAPTVLPMGLVITALTERKEANSRFISRNNPDKPDNAKTLVLSDINRAQMQFLQPDYAVSKTEMSPKQSIEAVNSGLFDAVVLSLSDIDTAYLDANKWQIQSLSVREFIPSAGQGTTCFITAEDDLPTRRLLKSVHHPSVSLVTNIERAIQKTLQTYPTAAYCERDRMGNYHLWAAALVNQELRKTRVSQSTSFGMAEKAAEQLLSA